MIWCVGSSRFCGFVMHSLLVCELLYWWPLNFLHRRARLMTQRWKRSSGEERLLHGEGIVSDNFENKKNKKKLKKTKLFWVWFRVKKMGGLHLMIHQAIVIDLFSTLFASFHFCNKCVVFFSSLAFFGYRTTCLLCFRTSSLLFLLEFFLLNFSSSI